MDRNIFRSMPVNIVRHNCKAHPLCRNTSIMVCKDWQPCGPSRLHTIRPRGSFQSDMLGVQVLCHVVHVDMLTVEMESAPAQR